MEYSGSEDENEMLSRLHGIRLFSEIDKGDVREYNNLKKGFIYDSIEWIADSISNTKIFTSRPNDERDMKLEEYYHNKDFLKKFIPIAENILNEFEQGIDESDSRSKELGIIKYYANN